MDISLLNKDTCHVMGGYFCYPSEHGLNCCSVPYIPTHILASDKVSVSHKRIARKYLDFLDEGNHHWLCPDAEWVGGSWRYVTKDRLPTVEEFIKICRMNYSKPSLQPQYDMIELS